MLTVSELIEELYYVDEVTLVETLGITSEDIVNKFVDRVEEHQDELRELINDNKEGFDFYDYDDKEWVTYSISTGNSLIKIRKIYTRKE